VPERSTAFAAKKPQSGNRAAVATSLVPVRLLAEPSTRPETNGRVSNVGAIEVEWPNGVVLRVPTDCDGRVVGDVVQALAPLLVGDRALC
jgi:hypothetical protein